VGDVITIDGPAGAGKTTTARAVAAALGFVYLDSGALYRAIAVAAGARGLLPEEGAVWQAFVDGLRLEAQPAGSEFRVRVDGEEVTERLRAPEVAALASRIATLPEVRALVRRLLRGLAAQSSCVAEGRDMGTAVFADAKLKIFLDAPLAERARRRQLELAAAGRGQELGEVERQMAARDERDRGRELSPLRPPEDAVRIQTAGMTPAEQSALIAALYRGGGWPAGSRFHRAVRAAGGALVRLVLAPRVGGQALVPRGPFILASNHLSYLDPPLLGLLCPAPVAFLAKRELFRVPGFSHLIRALYAIPLRRGGYDKQALEAALESLRRGIPVTVFPEGTRVREGERSRPRRGAAALARLAQVPVVPARLEGSDRPLRSLLRREPIRLRFGPPLPPPDPSGAAGDGAYLEALMAAIAALRQASDARAPAPRSPDARALDPRAPDARAPAPGAPDSGPGPTGGR